MSVNIFTDNRDTQEVRCTLTQGGASASASCFKWNAAECWDRVRSTLAAAPQNSAQPSSPDASLVDPGAQQKKP